MIILQTLGMVQPLGWGQPMSVAKKYKSKITVRYFVDKCENTILVLLNSVEHD